MPFDREQHDVRLGFQAVLLHDLVFMKSDNSRADFEQCSHLPHRVAFGQ